MVLGWVESWELVWCSSFESIGEWITNLFWSDPWLEGCVLYEIFSRLICFAIDKDVFVVEMVRLGHELVVGVWGGDYLHGMEEDLDLLLITTQFHVVINRDRWFKNGRFRFKIQLYSAKLSQSLIIDWMAKIKYNRVL
jgi:hypothetical protein